MGLAAAVTAAAVLADSIGAGAVIVESMTPDTFPNRPPPACFCVLSARSRGASGLCSVFGAIVVFSGVQVNGWIKG